MHIAFRVDSSTIIGHGHVMRCLTLAHALVRVQKDARISFISKANQGNINHLICNAGFQLVLIATGEHVIDQSDCGTWLGCSSQQDANQTIDAVKMLPAINLLIADHYAIDSKWHQKLAAYCQALMVIDDLANRPLKCDILLDQTLNRQAQQYHSLLPEHCQMLLGQDYMLLRDEFAQWRSQAKAQRQQKNLDLTKANIFISMGGGDPDNLSERALLAIKNLHNEYPDITATIVLSSQAKHLASIQAIQQNLPWCQLITDSNNMSELMVNATIAIGASGSTAWERCCLGLPSLISINAENQQLIAKNLTLANACINLGWFEYIDTKVITTQLKTLIQTPEKYITMVDNCFKVCDGLGADLIVKQIIQRLSVTKLKIATPKDKAIVFTWQSDKNIRKYFKHPATPTWDEHCAWFDSNLSDTKSTLYLIYHDGTAVGTLRLDEKNPDEYEVSILLTENAQGKGIGSMALNEIHNIKKHGLFFADIHSDNINSQKLFKKAGFVAISPSRFCLQIITNNIIS